MCRALHLAALSESGGLGAHGPWRASWGLEAAEGQGRRARCRIRTLDTRSRLA